MKKRMLLFLVILLILTGCQPTTTDPVESVGTASGYGGELSVRVLATDKEILEVEVVEHKETNGVSDLAITDVPSRIVKKQSIDIDVTSGATYTSLAILHATKKALESSVTTENFLSKEEITKTQKVDETTQVVIVGAGLSGLMAGVELKRNYPDINFVILEKLPIYSGSLPVTGGAMIATDSAWHKAQDKVATPEDVVDFFRESSQTDEINQELIKNVYALAGETFDWMVEFGVPFESELELSSPYSSKIYAGWTEGRTAGGGANFYHAIQDDIDALKMDMRLNSEVTQLIIEDNKVIGVEVEDQENFYSIYADKIILATGGFANNKELLQQLTPRVADGVQDTLVGSTGDGFKLVESFETNIVGEGTMGGFLTAEKKRIAQLPFMVNIHGKRFMDETTLYARLQLLLANQDEGRMFLITDSNYAGLEVVLSQVETGAVKVFETIEELANEFNLDYAVLQAEIDAYNEAVAQNQSPGFDLPVEKAHPILDAPFYAGEAVVRSFATIPGLEVNDQLQILDGNHEVIENLYGAGELVVGNVYTYQYPGSGVAVSWATNSGRYVGKMVGESLK